MPLVVKLDTAVRLRNHIDPYNELAWPYAAWEALADYYNETGCYEDIDISNNNGYIKMAWTLMDSTDLAHLKSNYIINPDTEGLMEIDEDRFADDNHVLDLNNGFYLVGDTAYM